MRPIIRWAGSKRQLVPQLRKLAPMRFNRYIEPFAGSACLFFDLQPEQAILGDINSDLICTYRQLRRHPSRVHEAVAKIVRSPERYYRERGKDPAEMAVFERAVRFIYLNRNCFNAVYRVNRNGKFNVPWGTKTGDLPNASEFRRCGTTLRKATLVNDDFGAVLDMARKGDFVYLDPPYSKSVADEPGLFGAGAFNREHMRRLIDKLNLLDRKGAQFVMSFETDLELARELSHWRTKDLQVRRHVAGFSGARGKTSEMLFSNIKHTNLRA